MLAAGDDGVPGARRPEGHRRSCAPAIASRRGSSSTATTRFLEEVLTKGFVPSPPHGAVRRRLSRRSGPSDRPSRTRASRSATPCPDFALIDQTGKTGPALAVSRRAGGGDVRVHALPGRDRLPDDDDEVRQDRRGAHEGEVRRRCSSITVDPENDTPAVLRDFASRIGADSEALEVPDRRSEGGRARRGDLRRPLLPGPRPDRPLAGGGGRGSRRASSRRSTTAKCGSPKRCCRIWRKRGRDEGIQAARRSRVRSARWVGA